MHTAIPAASSVLLSLLSFPLAAQQAATPFDAPVVAFGELERVLCLADLDGDGDADALGFWGITSARTVVHAFSNDGHGGFTRAWEFSDPAGQVEREHAAMEVGRFDADALDDFVLRLGDRFTVYRSNPQGPPSVLANWVDPSATGGGAMVVADFDGDGRADIAADLGGTVRLYRNTGLGFALTGSVAVACDELDAADVDGDGDLDLVAGRRGEVQLLIQEQGVLQAGAVLVHGVVRGQDPVFTVAGDIDADGDADIVAFGEWGQYAVLRRSGATTFVVEALRAGGPATGLADVDGDGDLDGVCCGGGGGGGPRTLTNWIASSFHIAVQDGTGRFATAWQIQSLGATRLAGVADVDGDGDADLVAGRVVWFNRGDTFAREPQPPVGLGLPQWTVSAADFDRDGDVDLASPNQNDLFARFHNDGSGRFGYRTVALPAVPGGSCVGPGWSGDFDGDGDDDLVVSRVEQGQFVQLQRLWNVGNGQLVDGGAAAAPGVAPTPYPEFGVGVGDLVADLDGDGDLDVASRSGGVAWNDGAGSFVLGAPFTGGRPVAAADFDRDGHPDLVVLRNARIEISYGRAGVFGGFGDRQWWGSGGTQDQGVASVADLDGDGDLDLVVNAGGVVVLRNDGGRAFSFPSPGGWPSIVGRELLGLVDADRDGLLDLVVGPVRGPGFAFLRGRGDATFGEAVVQLGYGGYAVADVDGDGDADFLGGRLTRNATAGIDAGGIVQYGVGGAGSGGFVPVLGARGPFRIGARVATFVRGAPGGTIGAWLWSFERSDLPDFPLPGIHHYAHPAVLGVTVPFSGTRGVPGDGEFELSYRVAPDSFGVVLRQQFHLLDPAMPSGIGYSNGIEVRYGR